MNDYVAIAVLIILLILSVMITKLNIEAHWEKDKNGKKLRYRKYLSFTQYIDAMIRESNLRSKRRKERKEQSRLRKEEKSKVNKKK